MEEKMIDGGGRWDEEQYYQLCFTCEDSDEDSRADDNT